MLDGIPPPDMVLHTIGSAPDHLTDEDVEQAVAVLARLGSTPVMLIMGGYDDDPRELWNIPEARDFIGRFVLRALSHPTLWPGWNLANRSKDLLAVCVGMDPRNLSADMARFLGAGRPQAAVFDEMEANRARRATVAASPPHSGNRQARRLAERKARKRQP